MQHKFDFSTAIGIFLALLLILIAINHGGSINAYMDGPSAMIVLGGTFAVTLASFSIGDIWRAQSLVVRSIFYHSESPKEAGIMMLQLAEEARKNGLLALQNFANNFKGSVFFLKGLNMIIDGVEPEVVEKILRQDIAAMAERHGKGTSILRKAAEVSPAMGLIGTLIGLVQMLLNLSDPSKIGPAMAVAILTTLYGAMMAYVVFTPLASKLERNSRDEILLNTLFVKGLFAIGKKDNPRRIEMLFNTILPPGERLKYIERE